MAPIRRYLRITKYSILEVRIYLDDPGSRSWLLGVGSSGGVLARIFAAIQPLVLPKLQEELEREKSKSKAKRPRGVKDTVTESDFEVSIFLTDASTRHSLLVKQKRFYDKEKIQSNSSKLTGWLEKEPVVIREESDDERPLTDFPEGDPDEIVDVSDDDGFASTAVHRKRSEELEAEEKKKLSMNLSYEGFSIYGRILCLVVKRRDKPRPDAGTGQRMLEDWVSTQAQEVPERLLELNEET